MICTGQIDVIIVILIQIIIIFVETISNIIIVIVFISLGEKEYEEGPLAGQKLPKHIQLLGVLLTGATVVSIGMFLFFYPMINPQRKKRKVHIASTKHQQLVNTSSS